MSRRKWLFFIGLAVLLAGCSREREQLPLSDGVKTAARQAADEFLQVARRDFFNLGEVEKRLFSKIRPQMRPRLGLAIKQARSSPKLKWLETASTMSDIVFVRYEISVEGQDKVLVLYLMKEESGQYKVTAANVVDKDAEEK